MTDAYDEIKVALPLGYLLYNCPDWDEFCRDVGLNPWLMAEGLASATDTHPVEIRLLRKYGILR